MCDLVARTGRHQQRYKDGYRLVAGWRKCKNFMGGDSEGEFDGSRFFEVSWCIPYRYKSCEGDCDDDDPMRSVEVLMINSQSGPGLLFPKGGWENDETVKEAAVREAVEEAGVRGDLKKFLGFYCFKSKSHQDEFSPEGWCKAAMYALLVNEELLSWPEQSTRERKWLPVCEAVEQCRHKWMEGVLDAFSKWLANQASGVEEEDPISAPSSPLR